MTKDESSEELATQLAQNFAGAAVHIAFDPRERCKWLRRLAPIVAFLVGATGPWFDHLIGQLKAAYVAFLGR